MRKSNSATHVLLTTYCHIESHLGKKQPQAKIAIAFLFGQLHFNNVTSHAIFYGGHLVMRSKRCAVQNQGITLSSEFFDKISVRILLDVLFRVFRLFQASFYALASSFMTF